MRPDGGLTRSLGIASLLLLNAAGDARASTVFASAFAGEGDQRTATFLGSYESNSGTTTVSAQGTGGSTHDLEPLGGTGDLVFEGAASAYASYHTLRAEASGAVYNTFLDRDYEHGSGTGVPTAYFSQGTANFAQTLQYGGTAHSYTSIYALRLTGSIAGNGRAAVSISLNHASNIREDWFYNVEGNYDLIIYSRAYVHGAFAQDFKLSVNTLYSFDMDLLPEGGNFAGGADFGNTLEVLGIDLRDENGALLPQGTITSDSGAVYAIIPAPEPSSVLLSAGGLLAACLRRRRR